MTEEQPKRKRGRPRKWPGETRAERMRAYRAAQRQERLRAEGNPEINEREGGGIKPFRVDWERLLYNDNILDAADYFFSECFFTRDEASVGRRGKSTVYKRFPWKQRPDVQRVVNYKLTHSGFFRTLGSRKIMKTWAEAGRLAFVALTQEARMILVGSTKEERADMNVQRIIFILATLVSADTNETQPEQIRFVRRSENRFDIGNGSSFLALTLNPNDLTQVTASEIWLDEFTKLGGERGGDDRLKRQFIATGLPATQRAVGEADSGLGGGLNLTGTCEGEELMWNLMFPNEEARRRLIPPHEDPENTEGLRCPENGLQIWADEDVHNILWYYFADEGKMPGSEWYRKERKKWRGNDDGWNREMEIWPVGVSELRVTPEYKDGLHARSMEELVEMYDPAIPLVIGWDVGSRYQCATVTQRLRSGRLLVLSQMFEDNRNVEVFARQVVAAVKTEFPHAMALHVGDPRTLATSTGTAYGDFSEVLARAGVTCYPAPPQSVQAKVSLLKRVLAEYIDGAPKVLIAKDRCRHLAAALREKYVFDQRGIRPMRDGVTEHSIDSFVFALLQHEHLANADDEMGALDLYGDYDDEYLSGYHGREEVPAL